VLLEHDSVAVLAVSRRVHVLDIRDGKCEIVYNPCGALIRVQNRVHVALGLVHTGQDHGLFRGFVVGEVLGVIKNLARRARLLLHPGDGRVRRKDGKFSSDVQAKRHVAYFLVDRDRSRALELSPYQATISLSVLPPSYADTEPSTNHCESTPPCHHPAACVQPCGRASFRHAHPCAP